MNHRLIDADVMAAARAAGVRVSAWTVNEEADLRRMVDLGVGRGDERSTRRCEEALRR